MMTEKFETFPLLLMVYFTKQTWFCQIARTNSGIEIMSGDGFTRSRLENSKYWKAYWKGF